MEPARAPRSDVRDAALGGGGDLRRWRAALEEAEQVAGRQPAQQRPVTAREDRGEVARFDAGSAVPDAVDARMLAQQRAGAQALLDLRHGDPGPQQLPARHHAVRGVRDPRELSLRRPVVWSHDDP
jgi:hypothetical protein